MFIPKELRLNEFKQVAIPENKWFFGRPDAQGSVPDSAFTGDEMAVMPQNKIDSIAQADVEFRDQLNNGED